MTSVLAVYLCLVVSSIIVKSSLTIRTSSVVLIGERVELKCRVTGNDVASWKYTSWNSSTETNIYLGKDDIVTSMKSRYKIDKMSSGQYNLIIESVDLAHAGRYRCTGIQQSLISEKQLTVLVRAQDSGVTSDVSNSHIGLTTLAIAGSLLVLLIINVAFACVVYRKRLKGDSNVRPDVARNTDLNSYRPGGDMNSGNEVYTDVCKPKGSVGGVTSDNEVYSEVCDPIGSDSIYDSEVYTDVYEPKGPPNASKGSSIGDNSRSPQIPTRERKDLIGADGTEHVELSEVKPPEVSHVVTYASADHSRKVSAL